MTIKFYFILFSSVLISFSLSAQQWTSNGTNLNNANAGNVGIGIGSNTPQERLHVSNGAIMVSDPVYYGISARLSGNDIPVLKFSRDLNGSHTSYHNASVGQFYNSQAGQYSLGFGTGSSSDQNVNTNAMTIMLNGNVGIGTSNASYKLTLAGGDIKAYNYDSNTGISIGAENSERPRIGFHVSDNNRRFKIEFNDANLPTERLGFFTNNAGAWPETEVVSIGKTGNVGLGTTNPQAQLDVGSWLSNGGLATVLGRLSEGNGSGSGTFLGVRGYATQGTGDVKSFALEHSFYGQTNSSVSFFRGNNVTGGFITFNTNNNSERMRITTAGYVGIGNTNPDAMLTVSGQVHAQEVKVTVNAPGPDYVFEKDYRLSSLEEIKTYIDQNKHLPEVPSAKDMEKNGVQLGEMNMLLLKKIEELTLHLIELKKENTELKEYKNQIDQLRVDLNKLIGAK